MRVHVNGEPKPLPDPCTVAELLVTLGLKTEGVAVAVNMSVVPRGAHATNPLAEGDRVEILDGLNAGAVVRLPEVKKDDAGKEAKSEAPSAPAKKE